jgi:hypothetical protein
MLAGLCVGLAVDGWEVTVVGRDRRKLDRVAGRHPSIRPLAVDFEDVPAFAAALSEAAAEQGPVALAVCWIRSWAPESLLAAAAAVMPGGRLFHVLGSSASDASDAAIAALRSRKELRYRQVQLGAVDDGSGTRWLTDEEISAGVAAAVAADRPSFLVGMYAS